MNKDRFLLLVVGFLICLFVSCQIVLLVMGIRDGGASSNSDKVRVVVLAMELDRYPQGIKREFSALIADNQLTNEEEKIIRDKMAAYRASLSQPLVLDDNAKLSELDVARENLAAFDRLTKQSLPDDLRLEVRASLVKKVEELSQSKE